MVHDTEAKHANGARLLAIDGGGVRGIMALEVLKAVMEGVRVKEGKKEPCRPVDYFELAAGTSTGGIIGIMLFRLHMTTEQAIEQYERFAEKVFTPKIFGKSIAWMPKSVSSKINYMKTFVQSSRFDDETLKEAIDDVVAEFGRDANDKMLMGNAPLRHDEAGRLMCCTTAQNQSETVLLRTYKDYDMDKSIKINDIYTSSKTNKIMEKHGHKITISTAACATSAAPTYFPEVVFPPKKPKNHLVFWDGGLLNNNPIDQLWYSRFEIVKHEDPPPSISCVLSLGTGHTKPKSPKDSWLHFLGISTAFEVMEFSTNTNAKAKDFTRHMNRLKERGKHNKQPEHKDTVYVRLNPSLRSTFIGLAEYDRMAELKRLAHVYIASDDGKMWIEKAVDAICARPKKLTVWGRWREKLSVSW